MTRWTRNIGALDKSTWTRTNWHRTKGNADLNTQGNGEQVETIRAIKKEGKQDNTGNTKAEQSQEDKTTKIKQETTK
ncbi:MAG: hypothetical protein ATN36_06410 [Epulopiscium sp. Nele67-Bin005]|nr:MAG: hypothetical protein ATN36_06410 [Epulopiscium sp. Nele67-Bin005]